MIKGRKPDSTDGVSRFEARTLWLGLLLLLSFLPAAALDRHRRISQFHHTAWTAQDGAPSQISALAQTQDGYLWIGSALGLFRFDGIRFEQYTPSAGIELPSNNIYTLKATDDGGLWISFRPSGLAFLKDGHLRVFKRPEELPKSQVYCFARTPDGRVWAGTHDGLVIFNGTGWDEVGASRNFRPNRIRTLYVDRDGGLWVSTDDTLDYLPAGADSFQVSIRQDKYALQLAQAADRRLWAVRYQHTVSPLDAVAAEAPAGNPEIEVDAIELLFDRDGALWLAAYPEGIRRIRFPEQMGAGKVGSSDPRVEAFREADGLSGNLVSNILEDREGNIWVGTVKGLDRFRYSPVVPVALPEGYQKLTLSAAARGEIWAGSAAVNSFLNLRDGDVAAVVPMPDQRLASAVHRTRTGDVWWGMRGGLMRQREDRFEFFAQSAEVREDWLWEVFRGDGDGGLWVNFGDLGLRYFKDGIWEPRRPPDGLPDRGPSASFEDPQGRLWLGYTENRVYVVDGGHTRGYTIADGVEIGRVKVIRGNSSSFWLGGELGLAVLIGERFHTVRPDGRPFGSVSGIVQTENGDLWLNEAHGIVYLAAREVERLRENPAYAVKYRLYDFQDNLPGGMQMNYSVSTAIEATDGRLWFATDNGLALIDPAKLQKNVVPPPVAIRSVVADGKTHEAAEGLRFPAGTADLQIDYTALSLSIPERVEFKYRLEGFEENWREAGHRRAAFYTAPGPGKYRFRVIAANHDGVWNEQGASLEFEILPTFYQTRWFLLLCCAVFGVLAWAAYKWRVHQVKSRLNLIYEERLSERTRIAQDLHDTLLQGIVSVSMQLDVAAGKLPADSPAKPRLDRLRDLTRQIIKEGRNTVNGLRAANDSSPRDLEGEIARLNSKLNPGAQIDFRLGVAGAVEPLCPIVHDEVVYICREALANAFRHAGATAVEVDLVYAKNFFRAVIRDNGRGIDPLILEAGRIGHWGLSGMKERAGRIGAQLKITSRAGVGTEIELSIADDIAFEIRGAKRYRAWLNGLRPARKPLGAVDETK